MMQQNRSPSADYIREWQFIGQILYKVPIDDVAELLPIILLYPPTTHSTLMVIDIGRFGF